MPTCPTCRRACEEGATACPVDATPLVPDPLLGQILGERYRLIAVLGEGGMGTVYRAEHVVLRKRMAVKVLRPELSADHDLVRRFQQEAVAASAIGQENIVDVTDFGRTDQGALYFVMEELEGQGLSALLAGGPPPVERALLILAQVCRALAAAHGRGIVHRDLKPDNVIVVRREDGTDFVKVVDFGISKNGAGPEPGRLTRAGFIMGTPEYMAPEQGASATVDHRADIYAFGVLAYELVTGRLPLRGENALATLLEHQTKVPEAPGQLRPGLPPALDALVMKALEKQPEQRQQSMFEVAAELTPVLAGLGLPPVYERAPTPPPRSGPRSGLTQRFEPLAAHGTALSRSTGRGATLALEEGQGAEPRRGRGRRARFTAALVLAVAAIAVLVALRRAPPPGAAGARAPGEGAAAARVEPPAPAPPAPAPDLPAQALTVTSAPSRPERRISPPARGRALGERPPSGDNRGRKLDDLKPDPF